MTANQALSLARELGVSRRDAMAIIQHWSGRSHAWLLAHADDDWPVQEGLAEAVRDALRQRADEMPLSYLLGKAHFMGLSLRVSPDVLVPRPDTEALVRWALDVLQQVRASEPNPRVLDLGTGSGAIALALAQELPQARIHATDRSPAALSVARDNARLLGLKLSFHEQSWWDGEATPEHGPGFHLVVSNPPYIAEGDPHLWALRHEPSAALVAGPTGLDDLRAIALGAPKRLVPGGWLLLEHGHDQAEAVTALLQSVGLVDVQTCPDAGGRARCTGGRRAPASSAVK